MTSKLFVSLVTLLVAVAAQADGQRLLVVMKSKSGYQTAQTVLSNRDAEGHRIWDANISAAARRLESVQADVVKSLNRLNTLVVKTEDPADFERLRHNPDVAFVEKEVFHPTPRPVNGYGLMGTITAAANWKARPMNSVPMGDFHPGQKTPWGIGAVKAMQAWMSSAGGEGVRVLILDTGIDKDHPSLSDNFEKGQDFVGDNVEPYPFMDKQGHGTHVAGTIAGVIDADGFTGVAPKASLLAGRVCSPSGCSNISIAQGINWGIEEGVDVISMSLGGMWSTPAEREAIAAAYEAGITIVAAAGNDGTSRISYPAALPQVIAVGAVNNKLEKATFSQYGPELAVVAPGVGITSCVPRGSGRETDVYALVDGVRGDRLVSNTFDGAADLSAPVENDVIYANLGRPEDFQGMDVTGKFVLVSRGEIKFIDKAQNAINAGATGLIVFNNEAGLVRGSLTQDGTHLSIPVFGIEQTTGESLRQSLVAGHPVRMSLNVLRTDYSALDGTSMATPHVSGVVALMKAANKTLLPAQVKEILQRTANGLEPNTNNEFGAGLVNAERAVAEALSTVGEPAPLSQHLGQR